MAHKAYKFASQVQPDGTLLLNVPLPVGTRVEVVVLAEEADEFQGLRDAAARTMEFWDNPDDDAEWNDA